ncbi:MAG: leucine-rich repeat domain-containing protein [Hyphomonadaceae bacterium]|nr:leucine-rich repeat domain-containing protein [Hyphomonadaceae bacterium]
MAENRIDGGYSPAVLDEYRVDEVNELISTLLADLAHKPAGQQAAIQILTEILGVTSPRTRLGKLLRAADVTPSDATSRFRLQNIIEREAAEQVSSMLAHNVTPPHDVAKRVISLTLREPRQEKNGKVSGMQSLRGVERCTNLKQLYLNSNPISSLEPIEGLPIELLNATNTRIEDIAPLLKMSALKSVWLRGSDVKDLRPLEKLIRTRDPALGSLIHDTHEAPTRRSSFLGFPIPAWAALLFAGTLTGCEVTFGSLEASLGKFEATLARLEASFGRGDAGREKETDRPPVEVTDDNNREVQLVFSNPYDMRWQLGSTSTVLVGGREMPVDQALAGYIASMGQLARIADEVIVVGIASEEGSRFEEERLRAILRAEALARVLRTQVGDRQLRTLTLGRYWGDRSAVDVVASAEQRPVIVIFVRRLNDNADVQRALERAMDEASRTRVRGMVIPVRQDYSDFSLSTVSTRRLRGN